MKSLCGLWNVINLDLDQELCKEMRPIYHEIKDFLSLNFLLVVELWENNFFFFVNGAPILIRAPRKKLVFNLILVATFLGQQCCKSLAI